MAKKTKLKPEKVKEWLSTQDSYTLHKPVKYKFPRRRVVVGGMGHQMQADLVDVSRISKYNKGIKFILTCIDVFSKKAWAVPLKDKTGATLVRAFESIKDPLPSRLQTDKGTEFVNRKFQSWLTDKGSGSTNTYITVISVARHRREMSRRTVLFGALHHLNTMASESDKIERISQNFKAEIQQMQANLIKEVQAIQLRPEIHTVDSGEDRGEDGNVSAREGEDEGDPESGNVNARGGARTRVYGANSTTLPSAPAAGAVQAVSTDHHLDVQEEYRSIADSVAKVRLPSDLKLSDKGSVKQSLRPTHQVIKRCGRYTETLLKLIGQLVPGNVSELDIANLFMCAQAEIKYIQDEYAALIAENRYGTDTAAIFRDLQSHTSVFSQERINQLKSAIELQSAHHAASRTQNFRGRGYSGRGRGRGSFRDNRQGGADVFNRISSRNVPGYSSQSSQGDSHNTDEH